MNAEPEAVPGPHNLAEPDPEAPRLIPADYPPVLIQAVMEEGGYRLGLRCGSIIRFNRADPIGDDELWVRVVYHSTSDRVDVRLADISWVSEERAKA